MVTPSAMSRDNLSSQEQTGDKIDHALRPRLLQDYLGQERLRESLSLFIDAARQRQEALDHVLLFGPPGLGKTTLAHVIAQEMGAGLKVTSGPILDKAGDLAAILTNLQPHDVLFVDEIHRLSPVVEEILYPALEDFELDILIGEGPSARSIKIGLPPFTLIGATTRAGLLSSPLRDRFGISFHLEFYSVDELSRIVARSASILQVPAVREGVAEIAARARGTPRIANRLLRRVRDYAQVRGDGTIDHATARAALELMEVDEHGFDPQDRRLLGIIIERFAGGPVGVESLAAALGEDRGTIEDVLEPFLIQSGYLIRTPRGRCATAQSYLALGLPRPESGQSGSLFDGG